MLVGISSMGGVVRIGVAVGGDEVGAGFTSSGGAGMAVVAETTVIGVIVGRTETCAACALQPDANSTTAITAAPHTENCHKARESIIVLQSITDSVTG
jgi:hypothetical protein